MIKICLVIVIACFSGLHGMQVTQINDTKAPKKDVLKNITYRLAHPSDLDKILHIYKDNFDDDDQHKLLVLPEAIRAKAMQKNIEKKRLFVATDGDNTIVSFVKVFVIDDHDELQEILRDELRFKEPKEGGKFLGQRSFDMSVSTIFDYSQEVKAAVLPESKLPEYVFGAPDCMYMYYGNAYTCREYRRLGIGTKLLSFAFDYVAKKLGEETPLELENLFIDEASIEKIAPIRGVALVYGQVNANIGQIGQLRPFANFVCNMRPVTARTKNIQAHHVTFEAYKPQFVFDTDGSFSVRDVKENQGRGNMLYIALN